MTRIAVIGAGPSGLAALRARYGVPVVGEPLSFGFRVDLWSLAYGPCLPI